MPVYFSVTNSFPRGIHSVNYYFLSSKMSSSPSRSTARSPHPSPSSSPFSMAARTGTNPLPPEAFAAFSFDPTGAAAESAETESPEVTLRHDHDHLPQDTDHEILLNELSNLGCTETTLSILANNQVNRHLWLQILNSSDVDLTLRDELQIESGLSRARIKAAYTNFPLLLQLRINATILRLSITTVPNHEPSTSTSRRYLQLSLASLSATEELI